MRTFAKWVGFLGLFVLWGGSLSGQVTSGTISGTVKDSSGAVLPGAAIKIDNTDTGAGRTLTTDSRGYYSAPNLTLGQYEITTTLSGFQTEVKRGITLNVGQNAVIDVTLQVGTVTERVQVTAEAPLIETTSANVAGLVNERQVRDLPLNARNLIELAPLYAGVAFAGSGERSASKGFATKLTISGTRYNASLFQLDGIDINDTAGSAGGAAGILMGAETIREFNIITNGYSAEYGKHTGGVFNAVTKSGTNSLHGSAFEFLRNNKLDARNFFDQQIPAYKRNQFGGSFGGPIVKDRTFFFGSYEGLRERLGLTTIRFVPSLSVRQGSIPNPGTGQATVVPINAAVKPFLDSFPLPNGQDFNDGTAYWIKAQSFPTNENFFTVRLDHQISDNDSLFGRYTFDDASNAVGSTAFGSPVNTNTLNESRSQYVAFGETRTFSPALINQFLTGFSRSNIGQSSLPVEGATFPLRNFSGRPECCGNFTVPGFSSWGGTATYPRVYILNMFQFKDDVFYTKGSHSLKFGFNAQRLQFNHFEPFQGLGVFAFNSIPDFLQGIVNTFNDVTPSSDPTNYVRQTIYGMYAQDDYRISPRLTLNLGLRYEFTTTPFDKYGRVSNLTDFKAPGQTPANALIGNPMFLNPSLKNFAPRIGLAWDPTGSGKTSIRAGAGIFYDQINAGGFVFAMLSSPPFFVVGNIRGRGIAQFPNAFFTQPQLFSSSPNIEGYQYHANQPAVYKYSLDIQRQVSPNTSVDVGFSGTRGVHLQRVLLMNSLVSTTVNGRLFIPPTAPFISPAFGRIRPRFTDVVSTYYALRLTLTRRLSKGLQFQGSYTYSKTMDDDTNWTGSSDFGNSAGQSRYLDLKERALAPFDIRHNFASNFTYDLPGKGLTGFPGKALRGWQMSGIFSLQGGNPFQVSTGVIPAYMSAGFVGDYPDVAPGNKGYQYDTRNPRRYFNPASFVVPTPGFIGNTGRSVLIGPGIAKFDFVLVKQTSITERVSLQFRSEFFNLFNRANFGFPNGRLFANAAGAYSGSVGTITTTATSSRQIQFGMRLVF